jgi:hypothetical protein
MTTKVSPRRNTANETKKHQTDAKMYAGENASGKNATLLPKKYKETRMPPDSHCIKKQCTDGLPSETNKTTESEKYKAHNNGNSAVAETSTAGHCSSNNETTSGKNATVLHKKYKETRMPPDSHCLKKKCKDGLLSDTNKTTESEKYKAHNNGNGAVAETKTVGHCSSNETTNCYNGNHSEKSHMKRLPKFSFT